MKITRSELKKIIKEEIEKSEIDEGLMDMIRSLPGMGGGPSRDVWSYNHAKSGKYELIHKNQPLVPGHNPNGFNLGDIQLHLKKALRGTYGDIDPQSLSIKSLESQATSSYPFNDAGEVGEILRKQIDQGGDYGLRTDPFYKALKKKQDAEDEYKRQRKSANDASIGRRRSWDGSSTNHSRTGRTGPPRANDRGQQAHGQYRQGTYRKFENLTKEEITAIIKEVLSEAHQGK